VGVQHRRYSVVIADIKFVLNIEDVSGRFCVECLDDWLDLLQLVQYVHGQERAVDTHVAYETREWMYAFNVQISLCSVLDCVLQWVKHAKPDRQELPAVPDVLEVGMKVSDRG
jgi:hypothetical protein